MARKSIQLNPAHKAKAFGLQATDGCSSAHQYTIFFLRISITDQEGLPLPKFSEFSAFSHGNVPFRPAGTDSGRGRVAPDSVTRAFDHNRAQTSDWVTEAHTHTASDWVTEASD